MTYEHAMYHKLMLEAGLRDKYDRALDALLEDEEPLSELVLELAFCTADIKKTIAVLDDFLWTADRKKIDSEAVFQLVCHDLYELRLDENISLRELTGLMYFIGCRAFCVGWENAELWYDMSVQSGFLWEDVVDGYLLEEEYEQNLMEFLTEYGAPA